MRVLHSIVSHHMSVSFRPTSQFQPTKKNDKDNRVNGCCMHPFFTCLCYSTNVTRSHHFVDLWLILNDPEAAAANPVPHVHEQKTAADDHLCLASTCAPFHCWPLKSWQCWHENMMQHFTGVTSIAPPLWHLFLLVLS